ncbi:signal peptidase I [PVC group bacterium (ex Bugula neritina AB1)]|nr:signal peptidase I [PVC group bacterium (ex Bugula neritina AB1)]
MAFLLAISLVVLFFSKKAKYVETAESILVAFICAMFIKTFLIQAFKIPSPSMVPTLKIGNRLLATKFNFRFREPKRGEVIIFKSPSDPKKEFVKRLVGLPGDKIFIKNGQVWINDTLFKNPALDVYYYNMISHMRSYVKGNHIHYDTRQGAYQRYFQGLGLDGQTFFVPKDSYFVLGDNSPNSSDSRYWGYIPKHMVHGKVLLVYWPLHKFRIVK